MASWQEERDLLVAQSQEFVAKVATTWPRPPSPTAPVTAPRVAGADKVPANNLPGEALRESRDCSGDSVVVLDPLPDHEAGSVRAEILDRVAAFRKKQSDLIREREIYYEQMQVQIQNLLGNDSNPDRL